MKYGEAFAKLGYKLGVPRQDWSASNKNGVCLSLWRCEIDWHNLSFDTLINAGPIEAWNPAGRNKRKKHLAQAVEKHEGWIDVVIVDGKPGEGVDKATPWKPLERQGRRWRVVEFDEDLGHFKATAIVELR